MPASSHGHVKIVKILLVAGADPKLYDRHRETARDKAVESGRHDIVRLLDEAMTQGNKQPQSFPEEKPTAGCAIS